MTAFDSDARPTSGRTADVPGADVSGREGTVASSGAGPTTSVPQKRGDAGWVGNVATRDLTVDAPRFQFKQHVGQAGAGEEFREVGTWDPEKARVVSVWRDPANGRDYIVNGHHRHEIECERERSLGGGIPRYMVPICLRRLFDHSAGPEHVQHPGTCPAERPWKPHSRRCSGPDRRQAAMRAAAGWRGSAARERSQRLAGSSNAA